MATRLRWVSTLILAAALAGCGRAPDASAPDAIEPTAFEGTHDVEVTEARTPVLVSGAPGDNCVAIAADDGALITAGSVEATWDPASPATGSLHLLILAPDSEGNLAAVAQAEGGSPLAATLEQEIDIPVGQQAALYLGSTRERYGAAAVQRASVAFSFTAYGELRSYPYDCTVAS